MIPHRHWVLYSAGQPIRVDEETKDLIVNARSRLGTRIRDDDWQGRGGGVIELPELIEISDVFGARAHVNPVAVAAIIEVRLDLFPEIAEWNAGMQDLAAAATAMVLGSSELPS